MDESGEIERNRARVIEAFNASQPIYRQLPLAVPQGGVIHAIDGRCLHCDNKIPPEELRGHISVPFPDGPALMHAYGYCEKCNTFTPFHHRVRGRGGRLSSEYQDKTGQWVWSPWLGGRLDQFKFRIIKWWKRIV